MIPSSNRDDPLVGLDLLQVVDNRPYFVSLTLMNNGLQTDFSNPITFKKVNEPLCLLDSNLVFPPQGRKLNDLGTAFDAVPKLKG